jgi:Arc/MetJ-type ribon-helix-helix transcriptional regulator
MRTTQTMTVSLPPAMVRQFEAVRKAESRTRSELVREALRAYFESRYPVVQPTKAELAALRRGRAAFHRGDAVSLDEFLHGMESPSRRPRAKKLSKVTAERSSAR